MQIADMEKAELKQKPQCLSCSLNLFCVCSCVCMCKYDTARIHQQILQYVKMDFQENICVSFDHALQMSYLASQQKIVGHLCIILTS